MWFPLHPLGYVLAGSHLMVGAGNANIHAGFWLAAFLAWLIRIVVLKVGGARAIREGLTPFCVGMFLAAVTSMIMFDIAGLVLRCFGVADVYNGVP